MRVLFLCTGNAFRSQMAEAVARSKAPAGTVVRSAGVAPAGVHPLALEILAEAGYDTRGLRSKGLEEVEGPFDVVVTLCDGARDRCPTWPGARRVEHWPLPDPAAEPDPDRRERLCRDVLREIERRVADLFETEKPRDETAQ